MVVAYVDEAVMEEEAEDGGAHAGFPADGLRHDRPYDGLQVGARRRVERRRQLRLRSAAAHHQPHHRHRKEEALAGHWKEMRPWRSPSFSCALDTATRGVWGTVPFPLPQDSGPRSLVLARMSLRNMISGEAWVGDWYSETTVVAFGCGRCDEAVITASFEKFILSCSPNKQKGGGPTG
ncbi:hypothetical protein GW17_00022338 [Ensete ventricosum]|nr:hypothetical protein GW17_00022338 [Ensete ventricosum]